MKEVQNFDMYKNAKKVAKRIAITVLCCFPILIVFDYLMRNIITSDALMITCYVVIMGAAVAIVEPIARAREKRRKEQAEVEPKKDVFR